jgi:CheY-like chemotaxis protein
LDVLKITYGVVAEREDFGMTKRILVVDDEPIVVEMIKRKLDRLGYEAFIALNGIEAIDVTYQVPLDLIFTDIIMPQMDGVTLINRLRDAPHTKRVPIVVFSAHACKSDMKKLGIEEFLSKPFEFRIMLETIERIFDEQDSPRRENTVMILDDKDNALERAINQMRQRGLRIEANLQFVQNGDQCLEETLRVRPDMIIVDAYSEQPPVYEIIQSLRNYASLRKLKVYVFSNHWGKPSQFQKMQEWEAIKSRCEEVGIAGYVNTFEEIELLSVLKHAAQT